MEVRKSILDRDYILYILLVVIAGLMRFIDLGGRAIHYDESLHAFYAWKLATGQGYQHNAMMHGPFQFIAPAFIFKLFGATEYTSRMVAALLGTAMVGLPYFLRKQMGKGGALLASLLLAFSPSMVYLSRFIREDIYTLFFTLIMVICLWRYLDQGKARYLYTGAAALGLGFATKETTFITVVIFGSFLILMAAREFLGGMARGFDFSQASRPVEFLVLLGSLSLPLYSAGISVFQKTFKVTLTSVGQAGWPEGAPEGGGLAVAGLVVGILLTLSVVIGLRWKPRVWGWCALIFWGIFTLLYTTFFTNPLGFASGMWQSLGYWMAQQPKHRLTQPWFYYPLELSLYEFLLALLGAAALVYYFVRKKNPFTNFLVYWFLATLVLYLYAGEKAPWLIVHLVLPLTLLAANFAGDVLGGAVFRARWLRAGPAVLMAFLFVLTLWVGFRLNYTHDDSTTELMVYAQGSADLTRVIEDIDALARETGEGKAMKITVDSALTWPLAWYLREYVAVGYPNLAAMSSPPDGSVLLLLAGNEGAARPHLGKYQHRYNYKQILWFPERHKELTSKTLFTRENFNKWWTYWRTRQVEGGYWKSDAIAFFVRPPR
ncbi:MAG: TIGR03663 family protein [Chloroflexi bacterium]|nr:TIGR03663 family protein [Chloroflexota bacterium]